MDESYEHEKIPDIVRDLADGISVQTRTLNRLWLTMIVLAVFVVLPESANTTPSQGRQFPFGFGTVNPEWFNPFACIFLSILSIAFASAHAAVLRGTLLAHAAIDSLEQDSAKKLPGAFSLREVFDLLRLSSITRVAPIAQLLRGEHQFSVSKEKSPLWKVKLTAAIYNYLKLLSSIVYVLLPIISLGWVYYQFFISDHGYFGRWIVVPIVSLFAASAFGCLLIVLFHEWKYMRIVNKKILAYGESNREKATRSQEPI